jgi:hypothetical protein
MPGCRIPGTEISDSPQQLASGSLVAKMVDDDVQRQASKWRRDDHLASLGVGTGRAGNGAESDSGRKGKHRGLGLLSAWPEGLDRTFLRMESPHLRTEIIEENCYQLRPWTYGHTDFNRLYPYLFGDPIL